MATIYLDWASTSPPLHELQKGFRESLSVFGNPSSIHIFGRDAENHLISSRKCIAECIDSQTEEVIFTGGATEANNMVVFSFLKKSLISPDKSSRPHIVVSHIEHASIWEPVKVLEQTGFDISIAEPDERGIVTPDAVRSCCTEKTICVFLMFCNNETGAIQPVTETVLEIRKLEKQFGRKIHIHTDAVQAFGKIWFSFRDLGVDSAAISAHKIGGPKGVGALILGKNSGLDFLYCGGGQESEKRPGTENVSGIYLFGITARDRITRLEEHSRNAKKLMAHTIRTISSMEAVQLIPASRPDEDFTVYSPYILSLSVPPIPGEVLVRSLDEHGIAVSAGSACNLKTRKKHRRVLQAMGTSKEVSESTLRISIGPETEKKDIDMFIDTLKTIVPLHLNLAKRMKNSRKKRQL